MDAVRMVVDEALAAEEFAPRLAPDPKDIFALDRRAAGVVCHRMSDARFEMSLAESRQEAQFARLHLTCGISKC
jgi:hypothetical protein